MFPLGAERAAKVARMPRMVARSRAANGGPDGAPPAREPDGQPRGRGRAPERRRARTPRVGSLPGLLAPPMAISRPMFRPLRRAVVLLLAASCTRSSPPPAPAAALPSARGSASPVPAAVRLAPSAGARTAQARCLPVEPLASPGVLAEEAADALARGENARALG